MKWVRILSLRSVVAALLAILLLSPVAAAVNDGSPGDNTTGTRELTSQATRVHIVTAGERCLRVTAAGVQTRAAPPAPPTTGGVITLGVTGPVVWAGLYWVILGDTVPPSTVTLNGVAVAPVLLPITASPCWPQASAFPFFADVTGLVIPGPNVVAGLEDSGVISSGFSSEGASLVAIYEDDELGACEIIVTDGNDLVNECGEFYDNSLPVTCGDRVPATLYFIGGDGQTGPTWPGFDDNQVWNGGALGAGDDFNASDPDAPGASPDIAWDTDGWGVLTGAPNTASINTLCTTTGDCINWVATVLEVGVQSCIPTPLDRTSWGKIKSRYGRVR